MLLNSGVAYLLRMLGNRRAASIVVRTIFVSDPFKRIATCLTFLRKPPLLPESNVLSKNCTYSTASGQELDLKSTFEHVIPAKYALLQRAKVVHERGIDRQVQVSNIIGGMRCAMFISVHKYSHILTCTVGG